MPNYLRTQDVLNVSVSCFANYDTPANPVAINLLTWLKSEKHRPKNEALRNVEDKKERDALKATLPAITPSGLFTYRKESDLIPGSHTRLIQFDIDLKENGHILNYTDLKAQICKLPFVAYCALSASGKGFWGLVPIASPERHGQHVDALKRVFAHYRIQIDTKPRNVASLRGYSYDASPYQPESVMLFELYDEPPRPKHRPFALTTDADTEQARVQVCINEVARRGMCIGENYADWYAVGCSLANGFGESGRDYYHQVSQHYPGYQCAQTDKQFTACLRVNSKATLGTFFLLCQQAGIEWKELMPAPSERPRVDYSTASRQHCPGKPTADNSQETGFLMGVSQPQGLSSSPSETQWVCTIAEQLASPGAMLKPDESQLERLTVEPCGDYPPALDTLPTIRPRTTAQKYDTDLRGVAYDVARMTRIFWQDWPVPPLAWCRIEVHKFIVTTGRNALT